MFAEKQGYCDKELPAISNAQQGEAVENTVDTMVSYTCLHGYVARNSPSSKCVASSPNEGIWKTQGSCILGIS